MKGGGRVAGSEKGKRGRGGGGKRDGGYAFGGTIMLASDLSSHQASSELLITRSPRLRTRQAKLWAAVVQRV